jgi:hypothetical protein
VPGTDRIRLAGKCGIDGVRRHNRHKVAFDLASRLASDQVLLAPDRELGAEGDVGDAEVRWVDANALPEEFVDTTASALHRYLADGRPQVSLDGWRYRRS